MDILLDEPIDLEEVVRLCRIGIKRRQPDERDKNRWHISNLLNAGREIAHGNVAYPEYEGAVKGIMSFGSLWELMVDCYLTYYAVNLGGFYTPDVEKYQGRHSGVSGRHYVAPRLGMDGLRDQVAVYFGQGNTAIASPADTSILSSGRDRPCVLRVRSHYQQAADGRGEDANYQVD